MSIVLDFKHVKMELVKGLYRGLTGNGGKFSYDAAEALDLAGLEISTQYAQKALESLNREDLVDWEQGYTLTETGVLLAEQRLLTQVPASDRVVKLDHNSASLIEIVEATEKLVGQLQSGNDVGSLSVDDVEVAIAEVTELGSIFKGTKVRAEATIEKAKLTLTWIGTKSAEALIGTMALALMALISQFFGIG